MREKHIEINRMPCEAHYWPAEKLFHGWEALVVKTYCHVLPGWFKIGATGGTLSPPQKSSAKWAGHLAGPGLVNKIRELWVGLNKRPQAVGQISKTKFFILEYHSRTPGGLTLQRLSAKLIIVEYVQITGPVWEPVEPIFAQIARLQYPSLLNTDGPFLRPCISCMWPWPSSLCHLNLAKWQTPWPICTRPICN